MHWRIVFKVLALVGAVVAFFLLWPMAWALHDGTPDIAPLAAAMGLGWGLSVALFVAGRGGHGSDLGPREAFVVVSLSWVIASTIGGLPFWFNGTVPTFTDGFFEAMSGFTTTGASVLTNIEANPRGILFWRSLTHWLGGMGIIVLSLAVLPFLGVGGMQLYKAEVPGPIPEKLTPRVQQTALLLWGVYVLISAMEIVLLMGGGMNLFEALTHTFGTVATGGFSPLNLSVGQYGNAYFDWVITVFMFLSGANFALHYLFLRGHFGALWSDAEFRFYTWVTLFSTLSIAFFLMQDGIYGDFPTALRYAAFQVVSILTTTGFVTADYEKWPFFTQMLLFFLMFLGGCAGSTGGGMKNVRVMVVLRQAKSEMMRLLHPNGAFPVKLGSSIVGRDVVASITAFFVLYVVIFAVASTALTALGLDPLTATSGVAATLGNVGPGLGALGPMDNYSTVPAAGKWIFSFCMLLGRLEIYTVMMLFLPGTWRH